MTNNSETRNNEEQKTNEVTNYNKDNAIKASMHFLLLLLRLALLAITYRMFISQNDDDASQNTGVLDDIASTASLTLGITAAAAQAPGIYNQFRHAFQKVTAVRKQDEPINKLAHKLPHCPGTISTTKKAFELGKTAIDNCRKKPKQKNFF